MNIGRKVPDQITIRPETADDIAAIRAVSQAAFLEAEHSDGTEQEIVERLRAAGCLAVSLVAELQGRVVGHAAVSPVSISDGTQGWYGLGPISVLPEFQRRGIGSLLMNRALESLKELRACGCVVLGDPGFYGRFGFEAHPGLAVPGFPQEYFLALPFERHVPCGEVSYHEAFGGSE